jgi:methylated-DNA-protein-cysteine methyltransferase-like protein
MELEVERGFREKVYKLMAELPEGKVTTYGDIAGMAGHANASRIVGGVAHFGPPELPWHRLVNRAGGLAAGFHGGREAQQQLLEAEGITCTNFAVDNFEERRWRPGFLEKNYRLL